MLAQRHIHIPDYIYNLDHITVTQSGVTSDSLCPMSYLRKEKELPPKQLLFLFLSPSSLHSVNFSSDTTRESLLVRFRGVSAKLIMFALTA